MISLLIRAQQEARVERPGDGACIGIDFGTVTSLVAILNNGRPQLVANRLGHLSTPSAVGVDPSGVVVIGEAARNLALMHPDRAEPYPKRLLRTSRKLYVDGVAYSGPRLVSYVLKQLQDDASEYLGEPIGGAVITAPRVVHGGRARRSGRGGPARRCTSTASDSRADGRVSRVGNR